MLRIPAMGFEFELNTDESEIYGFLSHGQPTRPPTWSIDVRCGAARLLSLECESEEDLSFRREEFEFVSGEGCHASISGLVIPVNSWHDLEGQRVSADSERSSPIMPHDPGELYYEAHHWSLTSNQIEFGTRQKNVFPIRWKFMAEDDEDNMTEVEVEASIPLRSFRVGFENPDELSIPAAMQAARRIASEHELGEPSESFGRYVDIPLLENH
ncbi:hypothetical protein N9D23_07365 [Rubripirellula sp.]|nr:hypothetical protein [Rubripirellula sp.]